MSPMGIDIDQLNEAQLVDLNNRIVERLRFLRQARAHSVMLDFRIGQRVVFEGHGGVEVVGALTRYNKKTVTVIADDGTRWNVSPHLLRPEEETSVRTIDALPLESPRSEDAR